MIDERELELWIARLEYEPSSWANYTKLATLYAIRDHQPAGRDVEAFSEERSAPATPRAMTGGSDFMRAVSSSNTDKAWAIMDELMDTLHIVNGKVYDSVMEKLQRA